MVAFVFGFIGYLLTLYRYPATCLVLGLVLGNLMEANFHRALLISGGSYSIFFNRPISLTLFLLTLAVNLVAQRILRRFLAGPDAPNGDGP